MTFAHTRERHWPRGILRTETLVVLGIMLNSSLQPANIGMRPPLVGWLYIRLQLKAVKLK
ncbi:uncharacterized protein METZ01_LOCUS275755 [marine metagenome]|uniref:Uncharacterized protein n=1 Tax=marine metagenome TaxID=408172 RepID=A0A382KJM6_9ZZZZ